MTLKDSNGAKRLRDKIISEAKEKAAQIAKEGASAALSTLDSIRKEIAGERENHLKMSEAVALENKKRKIAVAGMESRKAILSCKQELISEAFGDAIQKLNLMNPEDYEKVLLKILGNTISTYWTDLKDKDFTISLSLTNRQRLPLTFETEVKKFCVTSGISGKVSVSFNGSFTSGGFILLTSGREYNYSVDSLLRMQRENLEMEVVRILFGGVDA